ncbi:XRE family transcriptional regulator [bacterium]|jgi:transcriptional regulator with XRE-family HTH domain|nr:XRE family transcriptional regulator [bacterium]
MVKVLKLMSSKKSFSDKKAQSPLAENLFQLMRKNNLSEAELARKTGLSQQICNHILSGRTLNPKIETLIILSKCFEITVGQLVGSEPLCLEVGAPAFSVAPILSGSHVIDWVTKGILPANKSELGWISCDINAQQHAFAVKLDASHEPLYEENSLIIVDPKREYSSGSHVLVSFDGLSHAIRIYHHERGKTYLRPLILGLPTVVLETNYFLLGTIIESRTPTRPRIKSHF